MRLGEVETTNMIESLLTRTNGRADEWMDKLETVAIAAQEASKQASKQTSK